MAISVGAPSSAGGGGSGGCGPAHLRPGSAWPAVLGLLGLAAIAVVVLVSSPSPSSSAPPIVAATAAVARPQQPVTTHLTADAEAVCASESTLRFDPVDCEVPDTAVAHLCEAGLKPGHCGFVEAAAHVSARAVDDIVARFGRRIVVSGDSMARQTLLGLVDALRTGGGGGSPEQKNDEKSPRIAAEHYFHCDAVYTVVGRRQPRGSANTTLPMTLSDRLVIDRKGHCADGSNAEHSTNWLSYTAGLDGGDAFLALQVILVWHQVETAGTRTQDIVTVEASRAEARQERLTHFLVPGYGWSKGQADAVIAIARASLTLPSPGVAVRLILLPPADNAQSVPHGIRRRNDALRRFAAETANVAAVSWDTAAAAGAGRCDGVHYLCVLTPHVALGRPTRLRAPCPHGCNTTAIARYTAAVFDLAPNP